ncbi:prolyl oligopeptidase family serine peptidase [Kribbella endophytica]
MHSIDRRFPDAERDEAVEWLHGHAITDPYRWLEDPDDSRTVNWQAAQDQLWRTADLPGRRAFRTRVAALSAVTTSSPPTWRGDHQFFVRREPDQEHPVLYVDERVLIDPMQLDPSGLTTLDRWQPSPDGHLLAFQLSRGDEQSVLSVLDVRTGEVVDGPIDRCRYSPVAWLADSQSFYYVRSRRLCLHRLGRRRAAGGRPDRHLPRGSARPRGLAGSPGPRTREPDDVQVLPGEASYGLEISADGRWLTISAAVAHRNDVWLVDLSRPDFVPVVAQEGVDARTALGVGPDGRLYAATTLDAPSGRICVGDPQQPGHEHWQELIGEDPGAPLTGLAVLDGCLLVGRTRHAISELTAHDPRTGARLHDVPLPGLGTIGELTARPGGGHEAWFSYTDSVTPPTVYRYDARTGAVTPSSTASEQATWIWSRSRSQVPAPAAGLDIDSASARQGLGDAVVQEQVVYPSRDGTPIRMLVVSRARPNASAELSRHLRARPPAGATGAPPDAGATGPRPHAGATGAPPDAGATGPRPTILYGYGGFGLSVTPSYSSFALAWVEAGGAFVTANVRGGGEQGDAWHRAGTVGSKQTVVDDYLAAAETLIASGRTTPEQLGICGESNGGLLVGAALTQRPELFAAAVCSAPVLDMVRYQQSGLGPAWVGEYGSADDPEQLAALLAYSPYHRVTEADYPAVLFTVFGADSRVDPMHARKMCAALQHATTGRRPVLLRYENNAGHLPSAAGRGNSLAADLLAFLSHHTGLDL